MADPREEKEKQFLTEVAELDEALRVLDSSLSQIKWRLKYARRRLETGLSFLSLWVQSLCYFSDSISVMSFSIFWSAFPNEHYFGFGFLSVLVSFNSHYLNLASGF